ncbi:GNAT family acetyltransferase [Mycolicibacterium arabiense]|uniref:GNAT family acetyltransferase n=1 Tax=Mycolicibacterium arabiense TaxID=1286181 RepID=A0A7I7S1B9_9MYCO|nr:GNAT family N-acetyltransferase [Mycolicibacterium arabiense]MCV7371365.1 GNAT family N-acetyltransferase [Mycolicibacterium arabiense]BBY50066.1 GNAT family acetyltransferase [Mycolicibacterium arabiense]
MPGVIDAPLFCGTDLARRIEAAEAQLIVAGTEAARRRGAPGLTLPVGGGHGCFAEDGSPMNKVVGLGFGGVPDDWADVEARLLRHGPVQVELSNLADPAVVALLSDRGYRLAGFEDVLGLALPVDPPGVRADVEVRPTVAGELGAWVDVVVEGFAHPDGEGVPSHEDFPRDVVDRAMRDFTAAGAVAYVALCGDAVAGGGSVRMTDGIAQLTGAATAPAFRRRGVQAALLAARLRDAAAAGCDLAVVTTAPGSTSQKNVQRKGFQLLYTRAVLVLTE